MKELTIEEKAKRYDEAIERAKAYQGLRSEMEIIFPELKESEGERVWRELIEGFKRYDDGALFNGCLVREIIAWLEKQGGHAMFIEAIQVGDQVTKNEDGILVNLSQLKRVAKKDEKQGKNNMGISEATKQKLEDNLNEALEKETPESWNEFLEEQKPAWSEEDETVLNNLIYALANDRIGNNRDEYVDWLQSIKDRLLPQQKQEWSEEDENINECIQWTLIDKQVKEKEPNKYNREINWLKSLRPQKQDVMSEGEFGHIVGYLVQDIIANEHMAETEKQPTKFFVEKYYNKLRPQTTWKPSKRQKEALLWCVVHLGGADKQTLGELLEELNKL